MDWVEIEIGEVVQETPVDRRFALHVPPEHAEAFAFLPGQFVVVRDPQHADAGQRAYSLCAAPGTDGVLQVTVRDMGGFGHDFYAYEPGKKLLARPPQGRFLLDNQPDEDVVMVAGGSGITPFRSYVGHLQAHPPVTAVWLLQSSREPAHLTFRDEFEQVAAACAWFQYVPTVTRADPDDTWKGRHGRIDEALLREVVVRPAQTVFHACGPPAFVREMLAQAARLGVPRQRCRKEQWG